MYMEYVWHFYPLHSLPSSPPGMHVRDVTCMYMYVTSHACTCMCRLHFTCTYTHAHIATCEGVSEWEITLITSLSFPSLLYFPFQMPRGTTSTSSPIPDPQSFLIPVPSITTPEFMYSELPLIRSPLGPVKVS